MILTFSDSEEYIVEKILGALKDKHEIEHIYSVDGSVLVFEDMKILPDQRKVVYNGDEVELTTREFDILYTLARCHNQVLTAEQIYKAVTGEELVGDHHGIESSIYSIRKKLEYDVIQNIRGYGYRFSKRGNRPESG